METRRSALRKGDWVQLGSYCGKDQPEDLLWRVLSRTKDHVLLITQYIVMKKVFDTAGEHGLNRWRDSTLRHWLNSEQPAGQVDFGPHPAPTRAAVGPKRKPYAREQGFLANFPSELRQYISPVAITTPVAKGLRGGPDKTSDRVSLVTYEQYRKLPKDMKIGRPSPRMTQDDSLRMLDDEPMQYWARSPNFGREGVFLLSHWSNDKRSMNCGAFAEMGIRPCIGLTAAQFAGKGTARRPYVPRFAVDAASL
ncbi:MAG: hypothetical protein JKY65_28595 [Planctomycetes bacterium]|nr:hypothetical protein [Planctomycetota bacterium]